MVKRWQVVAINLRLYLVGLLVYSDCVAALYCTAPDLVVYLRDGRVVRLSGGKAHCGHCRAN